jgi:hypothetical protein
MAKKAEKKVSQKNLSSPTLHILISFFKKVNEQNMKRFASETISKLNKYYAEKNLPPFKLFGVIDYRHWLASKSSEQSLESQVKAALKK